MSRFILGLAGCVLCALPLAAPAQQGLYDDARFHAYTDDLRAYRIGDSLTVLIVGNGDRFGQCEHPDQ